MMGRTKQLELNIGDIIMSKDKLDKGETYLIVDKELRDLGLDKYYIYNVYSFQRQAYYTISRDTNNKHYKVLA